MQQDFSDSREVEVLRDLLKELNGQPIETGSRVVTQKHERIPLKPWKRWSLNSEECAKTEFFSD